jgi:homospermidine synthase
MASDLPDRIPFAGKLVMVGFGSIGQAVLPLLLRHLTLEPEQVHVVKPVPHESVLASRHGVQVTRVAITPSNVEEVLVPLLAPGDLLLNVSVDVSSLALVELCHRLQVLYLDTCNEPWPGVYDNPELTPSQRSNYALREQLLALRKRLNGGPTALVTQGANPGLVSSLVKQALLDLAIREGLDEGIPVHREGWAALAQRLDVRVIHVAERDTQTSPVRKQRGEFVNTWSIEGFIDEGLQPAELGWGSHEKHWPADAARHEFGCGAAILLQRPGIATRVRSWTPLEGPYHGFLVTHCEAISMADYYSVHEQGTIAYRPTVLYAYHPCDDAVLSLHEIAGDEWRRQGRSRLLRDEIDQGIDELGVLLMGPRVGAYWYGSRLSIGQARALAPGNNATTLQVAAGILGGIAWMLQHPDAGIVEPDEIDHRLVLQTALPYLGDLVGVAGDWNPLSHRSKLYREAIDASDPWQFVNFRVG